MKSKPNQFERPGQQGVLYIDPAQAELPSLSYQEALLETYIEKIAIVGTRGSPRNAIDSSVPLDVINSTDLGRQGNTDLIAMLSKLIPSLNANDQPINDASTLVRPANLRGMASDHTLVLVNGKRRHRSAVITFLGGGLSDGAQGPDIAAIPYSSISQVGVLRDGASAQYGSDAIAGVLNFSLNDNSEGGTLEARAAQHFEGDGESLQLLANSGLGLGQDGFLNLSTEWRQQKPTSRSIQRQDAADLAALGIMDIADPSQIWGTPEVEYDVKLAYNLGVGLGGSEQFYSFANYSRRSVEGGFFYRNPQTRAGAYVTDLRLADSNGDGSIDRNDEVSHYRWLVADLTPDGTGNCPNVVFPVDGFLVQQPEYQQVLQDPNCFAFNEILPGGFTPKFKGNIEDVFAVAGLKGEFGQDWQYDLSAIAGYSKVNYGLRNSLNPSLGSNSPTRFSPGAAVQIEKGLTLDLTKAIEVGNSHEINIASGIEWRQETYRQVAGDFASYAIGPYAVSPITGDSLGFSVGSNGFPGYRPETAGSWSRQNWAGYIDLESEINELITLGFAARYENFSDFGSTFDGKFSIMFSLTDNLAMRSSINSGFKAPTVGQSNVINVTTAFGENGLEDQATLPPTDPISLQLGATPLQPEESVNKSIGLVAKLNDDFFLTMDYFYIRLQDRISTTSAIPLRPNDIQILLSQGVANPERFAAAKYFTNDFDTSTQGLDLVLSYTGEWFGGQSQVSLNYNWTQTHIDRITQYNRIDAQGNRFVETNLTPQRIRMIEENIPKHRGSLSYSQTHDRFNTLLRLNYFGSYYEDHLDASAGLDIEAGSEVTLDLELGYQLDAQWQLIVGANNVFDNSPDSNPYALSAGALYPSTSPMGINGGLVYLRTILNY